MHILNFTPAQLERARALAGNLELAPTYEESVRMHDTAKAHAAWLATRREWHEHEQALKHLAQRKQEHMRLYGEAL